MLAGSLGDTASSSEVCSSFIFSGVLSHWNRLIADGGLFKLPFNTTLNDFVPDFDGVRAGILSSSVLFAAALYVLSADAIFAPNLGINDANFSTDKSATGPSAFSTSGESEPSISILETMDKILTLPVRSKDMCGPDIFTGERKATPFLIFKSPLRYANFPVLYGATAAIRLPIPVDTKLCDKRLSAFKKVSKRPRLPI